MSELVYNNTPLQQVRLKRDGRVIHVKREDLCCPYPGPSFSKIRGVVAHIEKLPHDVVGVLDTFHSKAGWAVSYVCRALGKRAVDYWPRYVKDPKTGLVRQQQFIAAELGATMVDLPAGRSSVLYHSAKKHLFTHYDNAYMMPNALKLPESITANAEEAVRTSPHMTKYGTLVISISSGTVAAGVLQGLFETGVLDTYRVIFHMGYRRSEAEARRYIAGMSGCDLSDTEKYRFIDEGYDYKNTARPQPFIDHEPDFPCNPHYDLKAWNWLVSLPITDPIFNSPIVFWNIGA